MRCSADQARPGLLLSEGNQSQLCRRVPVPALRGPLPVFMLILQFGCQGQEYRPSPTRAPAPLGRSLKVEQTSLTFRFRFEIHSASHRLCVSMIPGTIVRVRGVCSWSPRSRARRMRTLAQLHGTHARFSSALETCRTHGCRAMYVGIARGSMRPGSAPVRCRSDE